jgi:hypothetical protein
MQTGIAIPKAERSQHSVPEKQLSLLNEQPSTMQACCTKASQYVASVPAQSALVVQLIPAPTGGRLQ